MALHFVENLDNLATDFVDLLATNGLVIFSVPHPYRTMAKTGDYWHNKVYLDNVGSFGIDSTMIHRPLTEYIRPFTEKGFALIDLHEPTTPPELAEKYHQSASKSATPRRLNLCFRRSY